MKDTDARGIVLQKFYDVRHRVDWLRFIELKAQIAMDEAQLTNVCVQLKQHGLVELSKIDTYEGIQVAGGRITADGVDVVEGTRKSPITLMFHHDESISVVGSQNVQIGSSNVQEVKIKIGELIAAVDHSNASITEKREAKSLLERVASNPLLVSLISDLFKGPSG